METGIEEFGLTQLANFVKAKNIKEGADLSEVWQDLLKDKKQSSKAQISMKL